MKKGTNLTPKQRKFCEKYIELGNKQEAYRQSYNASRMTNSSIGKEVFVLFQNPNVTQYIEELQEKNQKAFIHTIEDSLKLDYEIIERYKFHTDILNNPKSTKKNIEVAERVLKFIGIAGFNAAQERIAKKLGYYEKDKSPIIIDTKTKVVFEIPSNGRDGNESN